MIHGVITELRVNKSFIWLREIKIIPNKKEIEYVYKWWIKKYKTSK